MPNLLDRENWMSHLNTGVRLVDSLIPASHDSSCYPTTNVFQDYENQWVGAVTQLEGYTAQLNAGVRYFDMRIAWHNGDLYMHHNTDWFFETFDQVLSEIRTWSDSHGGEYIFMDLDFDTNDNSLAQAILDKVLAHIDVSRIATAHINGDGGFNSAVTWADLGDTRFLITWASQNRMQPWLSYNEKFRYSPFDNFNEKTLGEITDYLHTALCNWQQDQLMVTQALNTPLLSFVTHPGLMDAEAESDLNNFIITTLMNRLQNPTQPASVFPRLNIVMRDFVNAEYNRPVLDLLIQENSFSSEPTFQTSGIQVKQQDVVRFRVQGSNRYMSLGSDGNLTLVDNVDDSCRFRIRDWGFYGANPLPYSGNLDADTTSCQGNFRLATTLQASDPDNTTVVSFNSPNNGYQAHNGVSWSAAADLETFCGFNPDDIQNQDILEYGSRIILRCMAGASDNNLQKIVHDFSSIVTLLIPFLGPNYNAAVQNSQDNHLFLLVTYDANGKAGLYAGSPGPDYATSFIIENAG